MRSDLKWGILREGRFYPTIKVSLPLAYGEGHGPVAAEPWSFENQETVSWKVLLLIVWTSFIVNLNQFRLLRVVGKGAFGKVRIVERKDSGLTFALKYIRKDEGESWRRIRSIQPMFSIHTDLLANCSQSCSI